MYRERSYSSCSTSSMGEDIFYTSGPTLTPTAVNCTANDVSLAEITEHLYKSPNLRVFKISFYGCDEEPVPSHEIENLAAELKSKPMLENVSIHNVVLGSSADAITLLDSFCTANDYNARYNVRSLRPKALELRHVKVKDMFGIHNLFRSPGVAEEMAQILRGAFNLEHLILPSLGLTAGHMIKFMTALSKVPREHQKLRNLDFSDNMYPTIQEYWEEFAPVLVSLYGLVSRNSCIEEVKFFDAGGDVSIIAMSIIDVFGMINRAARRSAEVKQGIMKLGHFSECSGLLIMGNVVPMYFEDPKTRRTVEELATKVKSRMTRASANNTSKSGMNQVLEVISKLVSEDRVPSDEELGGLLKVCDEYFLQFKKRFKKIHKKQIKWLSKLVNDAAGSSTFSNVDIKALCKHEKDHHKVVDIVAMEETLRDMSKLFGK